MYVIIKSHKQFIMCVRGDDCLELWKYRLICGILLFQKQRILCCNDDFLIVGAMH